jgi:hypothetical protein
MGNTADNQFFTDVGHIGYIVENIDESIEWLKKTLGMQNFLVYDFIPLHAWVDEKEIFDCHFKIAMCKMDNGTKIELIQPISGEKTLHMIFLKEKKSPNIHHISFHVHNYIECRDHFCKDSSNRIIFEAEIEDEKIGYRRSFYCYSDKAPGIIEVSEIPWKR